MGIRPVFLTIAVLLGLAGGASAQAVDEASAPADGNRGPTDLLRAAEQGDIAAQYELGVRYVNGDGVATDYSAAARWFGEAARNGNDEARQQLAFMASVGVGPLRPQAVASADGSFRVQVASVARETDGPREWRRLQRLHPDALATLRVTLIAVDAPDGAKLFRVEGGPLDEDGAQSVCTKLRAAGAGCRVVKPEPPAPRPN